MTIKRTLAFALALTTAAVVAASAVAGPITKQNGDKPVFTSFTSICAVPGYVDYGLCGGSTTTFAGVAGRIDAVQSKPGRYNLDFAFTGLTPGVAYRLYGNDGRFFEIGVVTANEAGSAAFSFQTTAPAGLGFDLNTLVGDYTVVTSFWSNQLLAQGADGLLYVP
jgi:hypothetical protein